jgi:Protein of unknown function (DUF2457)
MPFSGRTALQGAAEIKAIQNQPTSAADSEESGDADEPPDDMSHSTSTIHSAFQKSAYGQQLNRPSLLSKILHSESDSQPDDDDLARSETHRTQSSSSMYSRGSVISMAELTSDAGHNTPPTQSPSPPLPPLQYHGLAPVFKTKIFEQALAPKAMLDSQAAPVDLLKPECEKKVEVGLGRRRCITFACGNKKAEVPAEEPAVAQKLPEKRKSVLKFACPSRLLASEKPKVRPSSPPPRVRQPSPAPKEVKKRGSDATVRTSSPKVVRKSSELLRARRDSDGSDSSRPEATRFHEFASSEEENDDWTQEQGCFRRPLTVDDTLAIENRIRRLGEEVEEEEQEENEDVELEEEVEEDEDEDELAKSTGSGWASSDDGFQSDDEQGFAPSDEEDDEDPEFDWWGPGTATKESPEFIRSTGPKVVRSDSMSSADSITALPQVARLRKRSKAVDVERPELPDSTDFVCGTLDEDKPLERAYMNHLEIRRAAKRRVVPQDFDPTFPTSDPEMDEEEDEEDEEEDEEDLAEGSDGATESDHPSMFLHGHMDLGDDISDRYPRRLIPRKRSPLGSPKRFKSPPPAKRISMRRSPPPNHFTKARARSPAPTVYRPSAHKSSSVPKGQHRSTAVHFASAHASANVSDDELDTPETPRLVNRGAIDIVMGLEMKKRRRREKMYEKHCKLKAQREKNHQNHHHHHDHHHHHQKHGGYAKCFLAKKGKGAEKMREMVTGEKSRKNSTILFQAPIIDPGFRRFGELDEMEQNATPIAINGVNVPNSTATVDNGADVHMMSY